MSHDSHTIAPGADRRDNSDRRIEQRADRRAHDRYTPAGTARGDRRRGERRRSER